MSSFDRRTFLLMGLAALPVLSACGFEPVYGRNGAAKDLVGRVRVQSPGNRNGFLLVTALEEQLGRADPAEFDLSVRLSIRRESVAVSEERVLSRFDLVGEADFVLTEIATGRVVADSVARGFTGYSTTASTVATRAARQDAEARLMQTLADRIVVALLAAVS